MQIQDHKRLKDEFLIFIQSGKLAWIENSKSTRSSESAEKDLCYL